MPLHSEVIFLVPAQWEGQVEPFASVSEAGVRRRNPERRLRGISGEK